MNILQKKKVIFEEKRAEIIATNVLSKTVHVSFSLILKMKEEKMCYIFPFPRNITR